MPNPRKVAMLREITDTMGRATVAVSADYRGLTVAQITELRRALRPSNCEVKVVKNTLASMAADSAGRPEMKEILTGPTAIAFGFDDPVAPIKALTEHLRARRLNVTINGGWMDGQVFDRAGVESIATLPPKGEIVADIAGKLQSPLYNFAGLITSTIRNFAGLVDSRANQLEAQGAA
jgi:large subunit ribosomal protein L10